jgi:hypothetical protein
MIISSSLFMVIPWSNSTLFYDRYSIFLMITICIYTYFHVLLCIFDFLCSFTGAKQICNEVPIFNVLHLKVLTYVCITSIKIMNITNTAKSLLDSYVIYSFLTQYPSTENTNVAYGCRHFSVF